MPLHWPPWWEAHSQEWGQPSLAPFALGFRHCLTQPNLMTGFGLGANRAGRVKAGSGQIRLMDEESEGQELKLWTSKQGRGL